MAVSEKPVLNRVGNQLNYQIMGTTTEKKWTPEPGKKAEDYLPDGGGEFDQSLLDRTEKHYYYIRAEVHADGICMEGFLDRSPHNYLTISAAKKKWTSLEEKSDKFVLQLKYFLTRRSIGDIDCAIFVKGWSYSEWLKKGVYENKTVLMDRDKGNRILCLHENSYLYWCSKEEIEHPASKYYPVEVKFEKA